MSTLREISKIAFSNEKLGNTLEAINTGSFQRIADAVEIMAGNFIALQNDRDRYKKWYDEANQRVQKYYKREANFKGQITKLKKKIQTNKNPL